MTDETVEVEETEVEETTEVEFPSNKNNPQGIPYTGPMTLGRASFLLATAKMTFDEVKAGILDGTIPVPPVEKRPDPEDMDWETQAEWARPAPFASNTTGPNKITDEQYVELSRAISTARGIPEELQWKG